MGFEPSMAYLQSLPIHNISPPIKKPSLRFSKNQVKTRIYFNGEVLPKRVIENQI
jgi:hypothetical protein